MKKMKQVLGFVLFVAMALSVVACSSTPQRWRAFRDPALYDAGKSK